MALQVHASRGSLVFESAGYYLAAGRQRLRLLQGTSGLLQFHPTNSSSTRDGDRHVGIRRRLKDAGFEAPHAEGKARALGTSSPSASSPRTTWTRSCRPIHRTLRDIHARFKGN